VQRRGGLFPFWKWKRRPKFIAFVVGNFHS
jgi:hypothetical protein